MFQEFEEVVLQVEYGGGKKRRLYVNKNDINSHVRLLATVKSKIQSLYYKDIGLTYKDGEEWIVMSTDDREVEDIVDRATSPAGAKYKLVSLKVFEGNSPQMVVSSSTTGREVEQMEPKRLIHKFDVCEQRESVDCEEENNQEKSLLDNYTYKSVLDKELTEKEEEVKRAEEEATLAMVQYQSLYEELHPDISDQDPAKPVCHNCHTRAGHNKGSCPSKGSPCPSAKICGQETLHPKEKRELANLKDEKLKRESELKKMQEQLKLTAGRVSSLKSTFKRQTTPLLINNYKDKYLVVIKGGVHVNWRKVNKDLAILEKHYKGMAPAEEDICDFPCIIDKFHNYCTSKKDKVQERLEQGGVRFPRFAATSTGESTQATSSLITNSPQTVRGSPLHAWQEMRSPVQNAPCTFTPTAAAANPAYAPWSVAAAPTFWGHTYNMGPAPPSMLPSFSHQANPPYPVFYTPRPAAEQSKHPADYTVSSLLGGKKSKTD